MVVIAIAAIIAIFVVPQVPGTLNKARHSKDVRGVINFLKCTKAEAQKTSSNIYITINENDISWIRYYIEEVAGVETVKSATGAYRMNSSLSCVLTRKNYKAVMDDTAKTEITIPTDFIYTNMGLARVPQADGSEDTSYLGASEIEVTYKDLTKEVWFNLTGIVEVKGADD